MNKQGKFIVFYGINNTGKTTQAKMVAEHLCKIGQECEYLKYPAYDIEPSGKIINNYLREKNSFNLTAREIQLVHSLNRTQFENKLLEKLNAGIHVIAEDYIGTGLAWGMGANVDEKFLKSINSHLLKEDIAFLFDGERFKEATEHNHKHEIDEDLISKVRAIHKRLAKELGWIEINANMNKETITEILIDKIKSFEKK